MRDGATVGIFSPKTFKCYPHAKPVNLQQQRVETVPLSDDVVTLNPAAINVSTLDAGLAHAAPRISLSTDLSASPAEETLHDAATRPACAPPPRRSSRRCPRRARPRPLGGGPRRRDVADLGLRRAPPLDLLPDLGPALQRRTRTDGGDVAAGARRLITPPQESLWQHPQFSSPAPPPQERGCRSGAERDLAKVDIEGSNPFARSILLPDIAPPLR